MEKMKAKLIKTGNDYILRDLSGEVLGITIGEINGKLSLKNCQAIERGYDLDELAKEYLFNNYQEKYTVKTNDEQFAVIEGFLAGFQKALEILGDRRFTEEDVRKAMDRVWEWYNDEEDVECSSIKDLKNKHIQSLQQNEWEVEVEMDICGDKVYAVPEPKLDADGCLILKRAK